jgi:hypothetical protein
VGCTPIAEGARGRARCRKESVPTAMLGNFLVLGRSGEGVKRGDDFKFAPLVVASVVGEIRR